MDNISLFFLVFGLSNHSDFVDSLMIFGARFLIYSTFLLVFISAFKGRSKEKKALILAFLAIPIVVLLIKFIHIFFIEPRPFVNFHFSPLLDTEPDASFPSRHAGVMSAIAFSYTYLKSRWAPLFLFLMLWVGISRIYVGVHYPLDILGGFLVGIIAAFFGLTLLRQLYRLLFED